MKRQAVTALFATLTLCFWSNSVFADLNFSLGDISGGSHTMLLGEYDTDKWFGGPGASYASFWYPPFNSAPPEHHWLNEITFNDGAVSGKASAYYGYTYDAYSFTINLIIDNWVQNLQNVESLAYSTDSQAFITSPWSIELEPEELALMKVEITGATWDGTDPYLSLSIFDSDSHDPLIFDYDGKYYTTYLDSGLYHTSAELWASLTNTDLTKNTQINLTFEVVPVPGAALLGLIGLGYSGMRLRRKIA